MGGIGIPLTEILQCRFNNADIEFCILSDFFDFYRFIFEKKNRLNEGRLTFQFQPPSLSMS